MNTNEYIHSLPSHIVKQLEDQPETGMGYQLVTLEYTNLIIEDVVVINGQYTSEDYTRHGTLIRAIVK